MRYVAIGGTALFVLYIVDKEANYSEGFRALTGMLTRIANALGLG